MWCTYLGYFIVRGSLDPDSQLAQVAHQLSTVGLPGGRDGVYTSDASNDQMTALAVQCKETW